MAESPFVQWDFMMDHSVNHDKQQRQSGLVSGTVTPDFNLSAPFVPATPHYGTSVTPLAQGLSQVHVDNAARLTPLASPALPPSQINTMVNVGHSDGALPSNWLLDAGHDVASVMGLAGGAYAMSAARDAGPASGLGLHSYSMGSMPYLAPVTFMGMLQAQADHSDLYQHTMAGLLHESNQLLLQHVEQEQLQPPASAHGSPTTTRDGPDVQVSAATSGASSRAASTVPAKRKSRQGKAPDGHNDSKSAKSSPSPVYATDERPIARKPPPMTTAPAKRSLRPEQKALDGAAATSGKQGPAPAVAADPLHMIPLLSRNASTPSMTPLQAPFFTPVLHPSPMMTPSLLPMLPPAASLDEVAPPTPSIRPRLPESVTAAPLESKSNYQAMLEGKGSALGFSNELVKMVEDKRNTHKNSEKKRRDDLKNGFLELRSLIPGAASDKELQDGTYSKALILRQAISYVSYVNKERDAMSQELARLREDYARLRALYSAAAPADELIVLGPLKNGVEESGAAPTVSEDG